MLQSSRALVLLIFVMASFAPAQAAMSPASVAVAPPVQFPPSDFTITGLRASILYGRHRHVYGLDLGVLGNITDQEFVGVALSGLFNNTRGHATFLGAQIAGIANVNTQKANVYGVQAALGVNQNTAAASVMGLQVALANLASHTDIYGFQVGVYNRAQTVYGFQIGLVNVATNLHGIQIGLVNFHHQGIFSVSPILNIGF